MLATRPVEWEQLSALVHRVRDGTGTAVLVRGAAGMGKTALLDDVLAGTTGLRVLRTAGVEAESGLPFAALQHLCRPVSESLARLPDPQRHALTTAFGLRAGPPPETPVVALAFRGLLEVVGERAPVVCVVDDTQWLDVPSAEVFAVAATRLETPVLLVFAGRDRPSRLPALPEIVLDGLEPRAAESLLESVFPWPLEDRVRSRMVAETRGNPAAVLGLARSLLSAGPSGSLGLPGPTSPPGRDEERHRRTISALPRRARLVLLLAAADPLGDAPLLWRAAGRLELGIADALVAARAGLVEVGEGITFCHPDARAAAYRSATAPDRRSAHAALAAATDPTSDPDQWAWHRGQAVAGLDAAVAAELTGSAERAQRRGRPSTAAAFFERAAQISADPRLGAGRALAAAQANELAGEPDSALRLATIAGQGPLDEPARAAVDLLRAEVASNGLGGDVVTPLLRAAERVAPFDRRRATEAWLDALAGARIAGRLSRGPRLRDTAVAVLARAPVDGAGHPSDLLLLGLATVAIDGYPAGAGALRHAVAASRRTVPETVTDVRWLRHAAAAALDLWDDAAFAELNARHLRAARAAGALAQVTGGLSAGLLGHLLAGRLEQAGDVAAELATITSAVGGPLPAFAPTLLAAWRGVAQARTSIDEAVAEATGRGAGAALAVAHYARAVLGNGSGRYAEALAAATAGDEPDLEGSVLDGLCLVEAVEGAVRSGSSANTGTALERLSIMAAGAGTPWALGNLARSRALVASGPAAESLYEEALDHFAKTDVRTQWARTSLLYGEWLRREGRRVDARRHLRSAYDALSGMGLDAFADRARRELLATGETVSKRTGGAATGLTAQEAQIARLARDGCTNPEIAGQLFISARTVEWHLRKVFAKIGATSRKEMAALLPTAAGR